MELAVVLLVRNEGTAQKRSFHASHCSRLLPEWEMREERQGVTQRWGQDGS